MLEPFREEGKKTALGAAFCEPRFEHADTIVPLTTATDNSLTWYHWNHIGTTYFNDTISGQGLSPGTPGLEDLFTHRAFGAKVIASGLTTKNATVIAGSGLKSVELTATLLTLAPADAPTASAWLDAIATVKPAPQGGASGKCTAEGRDCESSWPELVDRSYIEVTPAVGWANESNVTEEITKHVVWDRYLSLIQGRAGFAPVKFNGQMFTALAKGSWDERSWGAGYWW